MSPPPFTRAAQAYARMGIAVFPLRPRQKKPLAFSTGLLAASASAELAAARWAGQADLPVRAPREPGEKLPARIFARFECNVACATGAISGFWVLDLDGPDAEEDLAALVAVHGELPETVEQGTGKGRHLCFAWDPEFAIVNSASKIGRGIDVRGNGGYIVLPPSIHPSGRTYAWTPGKSPRERQFAPAPRWLLELACPKAAPAAERARRPVERAEGTTKLGRATLATSCRTIAQAAPGSQQTTLFNYACFIGSYVGGGEIDAREAREALIAAGMSMVAGKRAWTEKEVASAVDRGMAKGEAHPRTAEVQGHYRSTERRTPQGQAASAAEVASEIREAREIWDQARPADCMAVRRWLGGLGLQADAIPGALGSLRAAQHAPLPDGTTTAAVLVPLVSRVGDHEWGGQAVEALAVLPLRMPGRVGGYVGDPSGKVAVLSALPADGQLLVGIDFADVWTLGQSAYEGGDPMGLILAPTLRTFAGGPLADRWGRMDPRTPYADPDNPPWTLEGPRAVYLAVRGDLRGGEIRRRRTLGGTQRLDLEGEAAARFFGGLAKQAWERAGANPVRILRPRAGAGFSHGRA